MSTLTIALPNDALQKLRERAVSLGTTAEKIVADRVLHDLASLDDPFLQLAGFHSSGIPDAARRHDDYLAESLQQKLPRSAS